MYAAIFPIFDYRPRDIYIGIGMPKIPAALAGSQFALQLVVLMAAAPSDHGMQEVELFMRSEPWGDEEHSHDESGERTGRKALRFDADNEGTRVDRLAWELTLPRGDFSLCAKVNGALVWRWPFHVG